MMVLIICLIVVLIAQTEQPVNEGRDELCVWSCSIRLTVGAQRGDPDSKALCVIFDSRHQTEAQRGSAVNFRVQRTLKDWQVGTDVPTCPQRRWRCASILGFSEKALCLCCLSPGSTVPSAPMMVTLMWSSRTRKIPGPLRKAGLVRDERCWNVPWRWMQMLYWKRGRINISDVQTKKWSTTQGSQRLCFLKQDHFLTRFSKRLYLHIQEIPETSCSPPDCMQASSFCLSVLLTF